MKLMKKLLALILMMVGMAAGQDLPANVTISGSQVVSRYTNCAAGTTINLLAKLVNNAGSPCIQTATNSDTTGIVGVVVSGAGTSGTATVAISGQATCVADNSVTNANYLVAGSTTGGRCKDAGASYPTSGQVVGRALASASAAGTLTFNVYGPGIVAAAGGGGAVTSVFSRSGVVLAQSGDYTLNLITSPVAADTLWTIPNANTIGITSGTATGSVNTFSLTKGSSNSGTGSLLKLSTNAGATGTMKPLSIDVFGAANALYVDANGSLHFGSGGNNVIGDGTLTLTTTNTLSLNAGSGGGGFSLSLVNLGTAASNSINLSAPTAAAVYSDVLSDVNPPTNTTTVQNSSKLGFRGNFWNGSAATNDIWGLQNVLATGSTTPVTTLTLTHSGSSGSSIVDLTAAAQTKVSRLLSTGQIVNLSSTEMVQVNANASSSADTVNILAAAGGANTSPVLHINGNVAAPTQTLLTIDANALNAAFVVDKNGGTTIQSATAATPSLIVKGQAGASTDLFRVTTSTPTTVFRINSSGQIDITNADLITTSNALTLKGTSAEVRATSTDILLYPDSGDVTLGRDVAGAADPTSTASVVLDPILKFQTRYWNGAAASDIWGLQNVVATGSTTPATTLTLTHSGSSGASTLDLSAAATLKGAAVSLQSGAAGTPTLIVKSQSSPSTDIFRVTNSSNTPLFVVNQSGQINITNADLITTTNGFTLRGASVTLISTTTDVNLSPTSGNTIVRRDPNQVADPVSTASVVLDPVLQLLSRYFNGSVAASDIWGFQNVIVTGSTTPASTLTLTHSGSSGTLSMDLSAAVTVKFPNAAAYTMFNNNTGSSATPAFHTMSPLVKTMAGGSATSATTFTDLFTPGTLSIAAGTLSVGDSIVVNFDVDIFGGSSGTPVAARLGIIFNAGSEILATSGATVLATHGYDHVTVHISVASTTTLNIVIIRTDATSGLRLFQVQTTVSDISSNALVIHPGGRLDSGPATGQTIQGTGAYISVYHGSNF
jgi:hypothetical protein